MIPSSGKPSNNSLDPLATVIAAQPMGFLGLDMVNSDPPDLVITDILMPKKEGMETIMDIRKAYPDIKIIAISGQGWSGAVSYLDMSQKLGANAALPKPFSKADLLEKIAEVLIGDSELA